MIETTCPDCSYVGTFREVLEDGGFAIVRCPMCRRQFDVHLGDEERPSNVTPIRRTRLHECTVCGGRWFRAAVTFDESTGMVNAHRMEVTCDDCGHIAEAPIRKGE